MPGRQRNGGQVRPAKKRIFVAGIASETHDFNKFPTTIESFTEDTNYYVQENTDLASLSDGDYYFGGYKDVADEEGDWELIIGLYSFAFPSGTVTKDAFESLWNRIESQIHRDGPFDAFLLPLHGGMSCEHLDDPEYEFVRRIRNLSDTSTPIAVSIDLHANLSPEFVKACDIICAFHTAPHIDIRSTGYRTAKLLARTLSGEIRPECHSIHPPVLFGLDGGRTTVDEAPMIALLNRLSELKGDDPKLLDASFLASYPYCDQTWTGSSAVVVMDGPSEKTDSYLEEFGWYIWNTRDVSTIEIVSVEQSIDRVLETENDKRPFLLGDFSDAPYAGAYGDGTAMIRALIDNKVKGAVVAPLCDKEAVETAFSAGVGATIRLSLGGKCDPDRGGHPIDCDAKVVALSDGHFVHKGPYLQDQPGELGDSCCLSIDGILVIVNTFPSQVHDREQLKLFGIQAEELNVIVLKAYNHMRADFEPICRGLLYPDSGGIFSMRFEQFPFERVRRPIYPLDSFELRPEQMTRT